MALPDTIVKINLLRREWDELQPISRENESVLWKKFRLEWNYNSNSIEGNTLTYGETELLLIFDRTTGDHEKREYDEMQAHDVAINLIRDWADEKARTITESDIRSLNKLILVRPFWKEAETADGLPTRRQIKIGEYKEFPNSVRLKNGEIFQYASPAETPLKMRELIDWFENNNVKHPLILAAEFHYSYIRIHPFDDGNGRIARLLVNYVLLKNGYPPIIIKKEDKDNYLTALQKADTGDKNSFYDYMAEQLVWSLEIAIKAAKGETIEEPEDINKEIELLKRTPFKNNKVKVKKSREVLQSLYRDFLKSLLADVENKLKKFDDLFMETSHTYRVEPALETTTIKPPGVDLKYIENQIFFDFNDPDRFGYVPGQIYSGNRLNHVPSYPELHRFKLSFYWKYYKNAGVDAFNISFDFNIEFEEFKYAIIENQDSEIWLEKLYDQPIVSEEMNEVSNKAAKKVLASIRGNIDRIQKKN